MQAALAATLLLAALAKASPPQATLAATRARTTLTCGVVTEAADWDKVDLHGDLSAMGAEVCRAVTAALLGNPGALRLVAFPAETEALAALSAGKIDLLAGATPSAARAAQYGVTFGPVIFNDAQTFLLPRALASGGAARLAGKTVCFIAGTDSEGALLTAMKARRIGIIPFPFQEEGEMDAALLGGHCSAISAYASKLAEARSQFHALARDFVLLDERLAEAKLAVVTRAGDRDWSAIVAAALGHGLKESTVPHRISVQPLPP